jgi:type I restriction enzyme S subunit
MAKQNTSNSSQPDFITEHLDIWTSAIKTKSAAGRGSSKKLELLGIKKLRELILELAVRGKLVPQDPNDEPASELLKKIEAEKARLVEAGKIKGAKSPLEINDGDVIYNPPKGWTWSRMGDLAQFQKGYAFKSKDYLESGLMITKIQNLTDNHLQNAAYISPDKASEFEQFLLSEGDIVMTTVGSWFSAPISAVGRSFLINSLFDNSLLNQNAVRIRPWDQINPMYLYTCVNSSIFKSYLVKEAQGTANQASITQISIKNFSICVPPKGEQHRIVTKVDELMALCDQLEAQTEASVDAHKTLVEVLLATLTDAKDADELNDNWQTISQHFDLLFTTQASIDQLKQTILQLAVMGKLVKQDPKDEPAAKLLERIATEKQQLIKDGKIKKQKPLPPITDEDKPFDLPNSWESERIGTFGIVGTGSTPSRSNPDYWEPPEFNWVSSGETSDFFVSATKEKVSALAIKETNVSLYPAGTLIVAMYGQGKTRGQITELLSEAGTNQACAAIRLVNNAKHHKNYVKLYFRKAYAELRSHAAGGAQPNLNVGKIANTVLALPPLAEQHRIVAKVDELMALCDSLEVGLSEAQTTQLHLTDAIVEQAS